MNFLSKFNRIDVLAAIFLLLFAVCYLLFMPFTHAASPQFLISWKAYNYTPSWYQGKNFPIYSTPVEISFELLENDKIVNLSKHEVRWYINNSLFTKGKGLRTISFISKNKAGTNMVIRIAIVAYKGEELNKLIYIPAKSPEVVINSPYLTNIAKIGETYRFKALPFLFNANRLNNLSFDWTINNQAMFSEEVDENPDILILNVSTSTPAGMQINLSAVVSNILNTVESATENFKLIAK